MGSAQERAALVALLRLQGPHPRVSAELIEAEGSAIGVLERELARVPNGQTALFAQPAESMLAAATADIDHWRAAGINLVTVLDLAYPQNLRAAYDRPPLIFVAGQMQAQDGRSVAVIGSRRASWAGAETARQVAQHLVGAGFTVVSGLAAGIDSAAHTAALDAGGRTLAVLGTGLEHAYPPQNHGLQRRIADECAALSSFWPEVPPSRQSFPARNAVMSALALGTVIVEASVTSGARIQARQALAQGRPVFLNRPLLRQPWASQLASRPGTYVIDSPEQITSVIGRLRDPGALVA